MVQSGDWFIIPIMDSPMVCRKIALHQVHTGLLQVVACFPCFYSFCQYLDAVVSGDSDVFKQFPLPAWILVNIPDDSHVELDVIRNQMMQRCLVIKATPQIAQGDTKASSFVGIQNTAQMVVVLDLFGFDDFKHKLVVGQLILLNRCDCGLQALFRIINGVGVEVDENLFPDAMALDFIKDHLAGKATGKPWSATACGAEIRSAGIFTPNCQIS